MYRRRRTGIASQTASELLIVARNKLGESNYKTAMLTVQRLPETWEGSRGTLVPLTLGNIVR